MSEKLIEYIKKGMTQGFNTEYIKKVLLKHGYSKTEIDFAIAKATGDKLREPQQKPTLFLVGVVTVAALLIIVLLGGLTKTSLQKAELAEIVEEQEVSVQNYLDKVADLSEEIDAKEKTIDQQIKELRDKELTLEEKDNILNDMSFLYQKMKQERRDVRDLLIELLKEVVERFKVDGEPILAGGETILGDDLTSDRDYSNTQTTHS